MNLSTGFSLLCPELEIRLQRCVLLTGIDASFVVTTSSTWMRRYIVCSCNCEIATNMRKFYADRCESARYAGEPLPTVGELIADFPENDDDVCIFNTRKDRKYRKLRVSSTKTLLDRILRGGLEIAARGAFFRSILKAPIRFCRYLPPRSHAR